jgi:hypothetical protein
LLQNRRFRGVAIFNENGCETGFKNDVKIDLGALGGLIFEILGAFLRGLIFDEFWIGKKCAKKSKIDAKEWSRGPSHDF